MPLPFPHHASTTESRKIAFLRHLPIANPMYLGLAVLTTTLAAVVAIQPTAGVAASAGFLLICLAMGLHWARISQPMWILAVVAALQPLNGIRPLPWLAIGDIALVAAVVLALPFLRRLEFPGRVAVPLVGTLLMTIGGIIGMVAVQDWSSRTEMVKFILGAPCVILILLLIKPSQTITMTLARGYAVGATVSAIAAAAGKTDPYFQRAFGYGAHQLHLALSCLFALCVFIGWFLRTESRSIKVMTALGAGICFYGVMLSGARSGLLGTLGALFFLGLLYRGRGLLTLAGGFVVISGVIAVAMPWLPEGTAIKRLLGSGELNSHVAASNSQHIDVFHDAIEDIGTHPLTGLGFKKGLDAHNFVLEAWNMGGVIALIGLILIWGTVIAIAIRRMVLGVDRSTIQQAAVLAGVLGYFVLGQFENIFWDRHLWFFITLALLLADTGAPAQPPANGGKNSTLDPGGTSISSSSLAGRSPISTEQQLITSRNF